MKKWNKFTHKILPFILIGVIASTTVSLNYNKIREVKAFAVVDDALVVAALLAMCGIAWTSASYYWAPGGGWVDDNDSNVLTPEGKEWADGFSDLWKKGWDEQVKQRALELGLIDENGNIKNNGGSSSGDDNNDGDHKFPSWDELKTLIANNKGKIGASMAFLSPFVALYGYNALENTKKYSKEDSLTDSGVKTAVRDAINELDASDSLNLSSYNSYTVKSDLKWWTMSGNYYSDFLHGEAHRKFTYRYGKNWYLDTQNTNSNYIFIQSPYNRRNGIEITVFQKKNGQCKAYVTDKNNVAGECFQLNDSKFYDFNVPYKGVYPDGRGDNDIKVPFVNTPDTLSKGTLLDDFFKNNDNQFPSTVLNDFSRIPTNDEFSKYLQDLNKAPIEDDKQKVIDDFINKITTPSETPTPDPKPDPSNPTPTPNPDTPDNPDSDNDFSVRDLRLVFPFCIPFDLVDCFRLFNSEPETPRVQFPVHFGIVDKDYTFDIDLKDFNNVALVCRSMFLILYIVGLVLATRSLIRG